ncbi:hypothetical protein [Nostoc sp. FACHB-110]|uniref:hypothetical protein n=1 Tax=Nostoc sp. FACHB-110 TaxID=2692834 RepID=UPI001685AFC5|nr:hypothetical protein [Nostoc sp. FACHB-110]MBD2439640.1 hypothetical protein [Nostoc sp. FACHB-110]
MQRKILKSLGSAILFIGVCSTPSYAGGASWEVLVERVEIHSPTKATIYLKQVDTHNLWHPECATLKILAEYQPENQYWSKSIVTQAKHIKALEYIKQAQIEAKKIRFGEIGTGLVSQQASENWFSKLINLFSFWKKNEVNQPGIVTNKNCNFQTKGLVILPEYNGLLAVYSFYNS